MTTNRKDIEITIDCDTTKAEAALVKILTMIDLVLLEGVMATLNNHAKVARVVEGGAVVYGIARHVVRDVETAGFPTSLDDVRDCFLRVTSRQGFEYFWPVADLMEDFARGEFVSYDW